MHLPTSTSERKNVPLVAGLLDYFPNALVAVAKLSKAGNDKHNPGEALHWARGKSTDHADCIVRHLIDRGTIDPEDGISHSAKVAWRALALLEEELERAGAKPGRGSVFPEGTKSPVDPAYFPQVDDIVAGFAMCHINRRVEGRIYHVASNDAFYPNVCIEESIGGKSWAVVGTSVTLIRSKT